MTDEDEYDPFRSFQTRNAVLRRGGYATLLTLAGGGMSSWEGLALTRWSADRTRDAEGLFIWLDNWRGSDELSAGAQPMREGIHGYDPALPAFNRTGKEIHVHVQVRLAPEGDAELRRVRVNNFHHDDRRVYATTYAELALNTPTGDAAHPAFSKLFVQTEWDAEREALLASRRLRSPDDAPLWAVHAVRVPENEYRVRPVQYETDRSRFVGRGHSLADPRAVLPTGQLSSTVGNVLDPVFSIRQQIDVPAEDVTEFVVILGAGRTREQARAIADRYATLELALAAFEAAGEADEVWLDDDGGEEERAAAVAVPASWMRNAHGLGALSLMGMPPEEEEGAENWYDRVPDLYQEAWLPTRDDPAPFPEALHFFNGFGGFSQDGREYVIRLPGWRYPPVRPPLPWTNVIANEEAGFLVSESGAASTWAANSRENRLTPWSNDPVSDPHGEALHLRDEEGEKRFWSPTPGPNPGYGWYEVRHGFGYTRFLHTSLELRQETTMFVPRRGPVKVVRLRVTNEGHQTRRLSAFSYAHLVLGGLPQETVENVVTRWDDAAGAIFATNRRRGEFSHRVAFAAAVAPGADVAWTASRRAYLGAYNSAQSALALRKRDRLRGECGPALDPCAALQVPLEIAPGQTAEIAFLLGEAEDEATARSLIAAYRQPGAVGAALDEVTRFWADLVSGVQVQTPSPELDLMVNGWLAYQNLSCRIWGRTAFYQSGGAFGFRDQLQDSSAMVYLDPDLTRRQIVLHASHQFVEGDVLHWWHPPLSKGIRTRFADDLLWLPYITAFYLRSTGDAAVLDESAPFLTARQLEEGEDEAFLVPEDSGERGTVYEHCCRSIDRSLTRGAHGLPLMGTGDWNDGMNRVGREGRGESVWMGFFLHGILDDFIPLVEARGEAERADRYRAYRDELAWSLNEEGRGWDGGWYRRAYYDNGAPLGSAANDECRIDAIAQAWAVLSGVAPADRAARALDALEEHLVSEEEGIIRLLTPAFDKTPHDPGYIKGYLPGVRENGGQYTHAALWAVRALAQAGRTERAARLLAMISPVSHGRTPEEVAVYQAEPYVVAADVYGVAPHVGRGGWTWYTGSAGWMFRVALESVLGITLEGGDTLVVRPCVPRDWPGFSVRYRLPDGATTYEIAVTRDAGAEIRGSVEGRALASAGGALRIPLVRDGGTHRVDVVLGEDFAPVYTPARG